MTWSTNLTCDKCKASYQVEVWDLGHKETDSISCECCGAILKEWKKEPKAYVIKSKSMHGNLNINHNDINNHKGKKLRFSNGNITFCGVVKGLSTSVVALSQDEVAHPWEIDCENETNCVAPSEEWNICKCKNV